MQMGAKHVKQPKSSLFKRQTLFTVESNFSKKAISSFHINNFYEDENPLTINSSRNQYQFFVNVWVSIDDFLTGPAFLPLTKT